MFRWVIGGRVDRFDFLDDFVFSPRTTFMIKPREDQTFRVSYNRAYRSPSVINNFLDVTVVEPVNLGLFSPALAGRVYPLPIQSVGNPDLKEQSLDAYEIGYTGIVKNRATVSAAFYVNRTKNDIFFTELTGQRYTAQQPAARLAAPARRHRADSGRELSRAVHLPELRQGDAARRRARRRQCRSTATSMSTPITPGRGSRSPTASTSASSTSRPRTGSTPASASATSASWPTSRSATPASAFWQDVLDARYHGTTKAYTLVNGGVGLRWFNQQLTTSVKVINLANEDVQQHVFGDVLKRQVIGELRVVF